MGWWSSESSDGKSNKPSSQSSIPPSSTPPQRPSTTPIDPDADFHAAFPHLAPTPSLESSTPQTPSELRTAAAESANLSTYPTTMSCTAAFDAAYHCSSFGGHFSDIYRYGELRKCSEHWADWRFCMSLTNKSAERKAEFIRDHYREKEERVKGKPNSEDIWERRAPGEQIVGAFGRAEEG